jgi:hypothetical protein
VVLFADDTNILITAKNILSLNEKIQNVKNQIENWFHENRLLITQISQMYYFFREVIYSKCQVPLLYK